MLRWCAYCQEFQGEVAPLDVYTTTHGVCEACLAKGMDQLNCEIGEAHRLRAIQGRLYQAGKTGDLAAAPLIVRFAIAAGLSPVDILVGLVTPLLYRVGDDWKSGRITIAEQQRFSTFCDHIYELIKLQVKSTGVTFSAGRQALVFLFHLPGNDHSLGLRILSLWLHSRGIEAHEFPAPPSAERLLELVEEYSPRAILISLALERQKTHVYEIARRMEGLPHPRPSLIVGGYAIKNQLIAPIPGTLFVQTMTGFDDLIWSLRSVKRRTEPQAVGS